MYIVYKYISPTEVDRKELATFATQREADIFRDAYVRGQFDAKYTEVEKK